MIAFLVLRAMFDLTIGVASPFVTGMIPATTPIGLAYVDIPVSSFTSMRPTDFWSFI